MNRLVSMLLVVLAGTGVAVAIVARGSGIATGERTTTAAPTSSAMKAVSPATLRPGDEIPVPTGAPVLKIVIPQPGTTARGASFDMATLGRLGQVSLRVYEPFARRHMTFTGVRLRDLFAIVDVPWGSGMSASALDDYHVSFTGPALLREDPLLALRADGKAIPLDKGGPTRIVFPAGSSLGGNTDNWIWSLREMRLSA
jgi:hypothetical protein